MTHGTDSGYQQHIKRRETPCDDCRQAHAEWTRRYREENSERRTHDKWLHRTRQAAVAELIGAHLQEFNSILARIRKLERNTP